jgi:hypothetical protein
VTPAAVPVIVAVVTVATPAVVTVNVAVVAPWATVTVAGTVAAVLSDERFTTKPPAGATLASVAVPVADVPPITIVGLSETLEMAGGLIVRAAVFVTPPAVAAIVAVVTVPIAVVVTVHVAVVAPAGTIAFAGKVAAALSLVRFTAKPAAGATLASVAVQVDGVPPVTLAGLKEKLERTGGLIVRFAVFVTTPAVAMIVAIVTVPTAVVVTVNVAVVAP